MTLEILSEAEMQLYNYTLSLVGTIENKTKQLSDSGTFDKYRSIYADYFQILTESDTDNIKTEALKRLIFLNWYSMLEPSCFTGMNYFDKAMMEVSYKNLNEYIIYNKLDREFDWMLSFYASWDWIVLAFSENKLDALTNFIKNVDNSVSHLPKLDILEITMNNRGQMGIYWKSYI